MRPVTATTADPFDAKLDAAVRQAVNRLCPAWMRSDLDDLVQDTMIRLIRWQNEEKCRPSSSIIRKTAHWVTVDRIRAANRKRMEYLEECVVEPPDRTPDPERGSAAREASRAILDCLAVLMEARRRAVVLHLQGHAVGETAGLLGWEPKQAENRIYRGLANLRDCLQSKGVEP